MLADKQINAIAICSPTTTHSDLITRAAAAGKHIFCEKPVDLSVPRAQACADAVKAAGVACMIGFQRRFDPTFNEASRRLAAGVTGYAELLFHYSLYPRAPPAALLTELGAIFSAIRFQSLVGFPRVLWLPSDSITPSLVSCSYLP